MTAMKSDSVSSETVSVQDKELGLLMRAMRVSANKRQTEIARIVGLGRTSVVNMEAGRQIVQLATLVRTGELCGFDVRLVVTKKGKKNGRG
jgi:DNA-binding XRE family transcriptional regulator